MKQAVVTGASKGLGKAFANQLAEQGYDLLLVARSENVLLTEADAIQKKYKVKVHVLAIDLSAQSGTDAVVRWIHDHAFQPSVLINNAGYACWGFFDKIEKQKHTEMMQVNMSTLLHLTWELIPILQKSKQAYILNVASTAAFQAVPTMIVYAASKAFVRAFTRGLRFELRNTNVSVTCLSPGPIATNFIQQAGMEAMQETAAKFEMTADEVARTGLKAMFNKKAECVPGLLNYLTIRLSFILPDALLEKIAANLYLSKLKQ